MTLEEVKAVSASVRHGEKLHPLSAGPCEGRPPVCVDKDLPRVIVSGAHGAASARKISGAAEAVWDSNLRELLTQKHQGDAVYFRLK